MLHCFKVIQFIVCVELSCNKFTIGFTFYHPEDIVVFKWNKHIVILVHRSPAIIAVLGVPVSAINGTQCLVCESGITLKIQYSLAAIVYIVLYQTIHAMLSITASWA